MKIYPIETGNFKLDGGAMFGVVPKSIWQRTNPADANNLISMSMRGIEGLQFLDLCFSLIGVTGWLIVGVLWKDRALILLNGVGVA